MKTKLRPASLSFRLTRLTDALLPASLLTASLFGHGRSALRIYLSALAVHLFSFGASHGVRAAFARQTTVNAVRGATFIIIEPLLVATAIYFCLCFPTSKIIAHFERRMSRGDRR